MTREETLLRRLAAEIECRGGLSMSIIPTDERPQLWMVWPAARLDSVPAPPEGYTTRAYRTPEMSRKLESAPALRMRATPR